MHRLLFILLVLLCLNLEAQYSESNKEITTVEFEQLRAELGYDRTKRILRLRKKYIPKKPEEVETKPINPLSSMFFSLVAYAAILILVALIVYLIFSNVRTDKKVDKVLGDMEEIEDIEDIDADKAYKAALAAGNYRVALRMQFIRFLQLLNSKEEISWEREKTNRDYHRELKGSDLRSNFRELATIYERVWYGEEPLDVQKFRIYDQKFITQHNVWR